MKPIAPFIIFLLSFFVAWNVFGQKTNEDLKVKNKDSSYISVGINFISDAISFGRKDSITAPYLYPTAMYHHKSGFYASGSFSYLTKQDQGRIDLFLITAGYDFSVKKFDGDISFTKYFFNDDSYNVISEVEADLSASFRYDFDVVNLGLMTNLYFNNNNSNTDFFLASEISHDFVTNNNKFQISPTAGIYLGSQNFYEQYYIYNRFGNGNRQGTGSGQSNGQGQGTGGSTNQTDTIITEVVLEEACMRTSVFSGKAKNSKLWLLNLAYPFGMLKNLLQSFFYPLLLYQKHRQL